MSDATGRRRPGALVRSRCSRGSAPRRPEPPPYERCEMCGAPVADAHQHVVNLGTALAAVRLPALLPAVHPDDAALAVPGGARTATCPSRTWPLPVWEELQLPVGMAFLFLNSALDRVVAFYPGPAGATESRAAARRLGRGRRGHPGAGDAGARRRGAAGARRAASGSRRSWCRSTSATSWSATCARCGAASTAGRTCAAAGRVLRHRASELPAAPSRRWRRDRAGLRGPRRPRRSSTPPRRTCCSGCGSPRPPARVVHAIALRAQIRIEPQRRPYDAGEQDGLADLFGTPDRCAEHAQAVPLDPRRRDGAGLHRARRGRPAGAVHLRLRGQRPRSTCTRCGDGEVPLRAAVQRHGLHPRRDRLRGRAAVRGRSRRGAGCRCASWRELMDLYFPGGGWIRLDRDTIDALARLPVGARPHVVGADRRRAAARRR